MSKTIRFGLAAVLALAVSAPAWAGDDRTDEDNASTLSHDTATGDPSGSLESLSAALNSYFTASEVGSEGSEEGSGSGEPDSSNESLNAYTNDRDLQEIWSANGGG